MGCDIVGATCVTLKTPGPPLQDYLGTNPTAVFPAWWFTPPGDADFLFSRVGNLIMSMLQEYRSAEFCILATKPVSTIIDNFDEWRSTWWSPVRGDRDIGWSDCGHGKNSKWMYMWHVAMFAFILSQALSTVSSDAITLISFIRGEGWWPKIGLCA